MNTYRLDQLKQYLEEDPNDPFNWYALANEYLLESPEKAKEYFEHLLENHPGYLATYYHAAQLYFDLEEEELAKVTYEKGIALAKEENNQKALRELNTAYQNLLFEMD